MFFISRHIRAFFIYVCTIILRTHTLLKRCMRIIHLLCPGIFVQTNVYREKISSIQTIFCK